ncbi:AraC family transcriptional regulator [Brumimicrobium salinarum]|uniref:AraC family transcriptional regulator n=1 Tax=Brumimicrobium salinarum TaxID=2058658 RepID=A0A2I0R0Y6_9FLAO|nr:AraC family transcriptional regulator [Brumimicrobium salinarum]PKR80205.1 AraC family transcriptional regulator [Brumimicrobium salinarum]
MSKTLHIKNMVCPRCITAVENTLKEMQIQTEKVQLGQVFLKEDLTDKVRDELSQKLNELGFELLSSTTAQLISEIKTAIIQQIHHTSEPLSINFSDFLSTELNYDYTYLSRLFSEVEGITINRFIIIQKIEKVKELLFYGEMTTAEIAHQLNYNSVAYLSGVFKKETGMTLSQFKELRDPDRKGIDW